MASQEDIKPTLDENFEWNVETEIQLFEAMLGHRPVGINKHFHMACICDKFESLLGKSVSSEVIWKHLDSMYDLTALDKKESLPFPNEEEEFCLPEAEYSELITQKLASIVNKTELLSEPQVKDEKSAPKSVKETLQTKDVPVKKDKKGEQEEATPVTVKKENEESENEAKKGKTKKEEKPIIKRGKRSLKDKKNEEESSPAPSASNKKSDDDSSSSQNSNKKEKQSVGKRTLRSRADEGSSSKSSTPPPAKRARRI